MFKTNAHVFYILLILLSIITFTVAEVQADQENSSSEILSYYCIDAELDTLQNLLYGSESVSFHNPLDYSLNVIVFHLYPNAFRDTLTMLASGDDKIKQAIAHNAGYIDCDSITVDGSLPDSVVLKETLLYIYPRSRLATGETIKIKMNFKLKIPPAIIRIGYDENDNYLFSHWHPILVGYQKNKPVIFDYKIHTEFFSNFADYELNLTLPENFSLGSTAGICEPNSIVGNKAIYKLKAERVIDFAFVCGSGWEIDTFTFDKINISIMYLPENEERISRVREVISSSLDYFNDKLFNYPYDNLVFTDFNPGAGGMELPGMVIMSFEGRRTRSKQGLSMTLIHEIAHQWFYATVATNEAFEPWLDEGLVSYLTDRAMEHIFGRAVMIDSYGISLSLTEFGAIAIRLTEAIDPLATPADKFHDNHYFYAVYSRAAAVLKTLEGVLGTETFDNALKDFAVKYKFKHPDSYDLQRSLEQSAGMDLEWFFNAYIFGTARVDYEVVSVESKYVKDSMPDNISDAGFYQTSVEVRRHYEGILPQKLEVLFDDGSYQQVHWDGEERYRLFEFESSSPAVWATIDREYYYLVDENMVNNSRKVHQELMPVFSIVSSGGFLVQLFLSLLELL